MALMISQLRSMISLEVGLRSVDCSDMVFQGKRIQFFVSLQLFCILISFFAFVAASLHIFYIPVLFIVHYFTFEVKD